MQRLGIYIINTNIISYTPLNHNKKNVIVIILFYQLGTKGQTQKAPVGA